MTLLVEVLSPNVGELALRLDVVNDDRAVLDQFLEEEVSPRDVFCPRGEGAIADHMKRRRVVHVERNAVESILEF